MTLPRAAEPAFREELQPIIELRSPFTNSELVSGGLGRSPHPLLERDEELRRIAELIEQAASTGQGAALVVEGPAGIGKTRLLEAARRLAVDQELAVLAARAAEVEQGFAFGLVRQLFDPALAAADSAEREELLAGAAGLSLGALGEGTDRAEIVDADAVLYGLYWLVAGLARPRPLLLVVDDAHWGDEASLRFLGYIFRRAESLPVLVVVGCRPPAGGPGDARLGELLADPAAEVVRPRPLGAGGVARVLSERLGGSSDPEFSEACLAATGGNPFLLTELSRTLAEKRIEPRAREATKVEELHPENVARSLMVRLGRAGKEAEALAPAIAVLGDGAQLALAADLASLSQEAAAGGLDALMREGVVVADLPPRFAHPLLRTAAEGLLAPGERSLLHARAAELLNQRGAPADRVAQHLLETEPGGDPAVVATLASAARLAQQRGAPDVAAGFLRRGLEEQPTDDRRFELLFELGRAELSLGMPSASVHLSAAADAPDPVVAARAVRSFTVSGGDSRERLEASLPLLDRAIERLADRDPELSLELKAVRLYPLWVLPENFERFERELALFQDSSGDSAAESYALSFVARSLTWRGEPASVVAAAAERAAAKPAALHQPWFRMWLGYVVNDLVAVDRIEAAERVIEQAIAIARERGSMGRFTGASHARAVCRLAAGDLGAAEADARVVLPSAPSRTGWLGLALLLRSLIDQGKLAESKQVLAEWDLEVTVPDTRRMNPTLVERGRLRVATGATDAGIADLEEAVTRLARLWSLHVGLGGVEPRLELALALRAAGRHADARREAELGLEAARRWGTNSAVGAALRVRGLTTGGVGGLGLLAESVAVLSKSPARLYHARALVDYGAALRRAGRRSESREPLREGLELAERCGAVPLEESARLELAATGVKVPRRDADREALTVSERRVAELAADGASNPEIAQQLFVTIKTVEGHLSAVYRKLDIRSRRELSAVLAARNPRDYVARSRVPPGDNVGLGRGG